MSLKTIILQFFNDSRTASDRARTQQYLEETKVLRDEVSAAVGLEWGGIGGELENQTDLQEALDSKVSGAHIHDDRYYTETEMDTALGGKADNGHTHDDRYYTEGEVNTALAGKADTGHTHTDKANLSGGNTYQNGDQILNDSGNARKNFVIHKFIGDTGATDAPTVILLEEYTTNNKQISGRITGISSLHNSRDRMIIDVTGTFKTGGEAQINVSVKKTHNNHSIVRLVTCTYNDTDYVGIEFGSTTANWYPDLWFFQGQHYEPDPVFPKAELVSNVTNINPFTPDQTSQDYHFVDEAYFKGLIDVDGVVRSATGFSTDGGATVFDQSTIDGKSNNAVASTAANIDFTTPKVFDSPGTPRTGNITEDLTNAKIGVVQKIYHNSGTTPTFPAGWVKLNGSQDYVTSSLNIIYCEWVSASRVEYWIVQEA